jgi:hypothetical protein
MAPQKIALVPGKCNGHTRLNGTKAPICHTCSNYSLRRPDIEPAAVFVDGRFDCAEWRGHGAPNVRHGTDEGKPYLVGVELHPAALVRG